MDIFWHHIGKGEPATTNYNKTVANPKLIDELPEVDIEVEEKKVPYVEILRNEFSEGKCSIWGFPNRTKERRDRLPSRGSLLLFLASDRESADFLSFGVIRQSFQSHSRSVSSIFWNDSTFWHYVFFVNVPLQRYTFADFISDFGLPKDLRGNGWINQVAKHYQANFRKPISYLDHLYKFRVQK